MSKSAPMYVNLVPTTPLAQLERYAPPGGAVANNDPFSALRPRSMSSLIGYVPVDGGHLLDYLKAVRRVVEAPRDPSVSRMDDALARVTRIIALPPRPTYALDDAYELQPTEALENYTTKIFGGDHEVLEFVLDAAFGTRYRDLEPQERQAAIAAGCASLTDTIGRTLAQQCTALGWPLVKLAVKRDGAAWLGRDGRRSGPERAALSYVLGIGERGSACEGDTIKVLMKAACFEFLASRHRFDRVSAARMLFEAHCQTLLDERASIVDAIRTSQRDAVARAVEFILQHAPVGASKVPLDRGMLLQVYDTLGAEKLAQIAAVFAHRPYDYRAGWPDVTIAGPTGLRLVEVKTTDKFHASQMRFAREVAAPLGLPCSVVQLQPPRDGDASTQD